MLRCSTLGLRHHVETHQQTCRNHWCALSLGLGGILAATLPDRLVQELCKAVYKADPLPFVEWIAIHTPSAMSKSKLC